MKYLQGDLLHFFYSFALFKYISEVRTIPALLSGCGSKRHQMGVQWSLFHASVPNRRDIYIIIPTVFGLVTLSRGVFHLIELLRGLGNGPELCYLHFFHSFSKLVFELAYSRDGLLIRTTPFTMVYILFLVGLLTIGPRKAIKLTTKKLSQLFSITDLVE